MILDTLLKGRVGKNGETSSSALEFESTQLKKIHMTNEGTR